VSRYIDCYSWAKISEF
jgi:hypothetical protein